MEMLDLYKLDFKQKENRIALVKEVMKIYKLNEKPTEEKIARLASYMVGRLKLDELYITKVGNTAYLDITKGETKFGTLYARNKQEMLYKFLVYAHLKRELS